MKNISSCIAITLIFLLLPMYSYTMTPGILDPSFGGGTLGPIPGTVITDFNGGFDSANAIIRQPDHKLVAAGRATISGNPTFGLARYNSDGALDPSFGGNPAPGRVFTDFDNFGSANALILQPSGTYLKLVAARQAIAGQAGRDFGLAQYFAINNISPLASAVIAKYC